MLNIGNLVVDSLDYIMIVDKNYKIVYNTRYDASLNMQSQEYLYRDISNKNYFEMYPDLKKEDSSIVRALETGQIIVNKRQEYYDYIGRRFVTNNVTFPLKRMGEIMAAVELAIDADENEDIQVLLFQVMY